MIVLQANRLILENNEKATFNVNVKADDGYGQGGTDGLVRGEKKGTHLRYSFIGILHSSLP